MSDIKIQPSATGSATVTLTAPVSNTARTITLPDSTGTLALTTGDDDKLLLTGGTMTGDLTVSGASGLDGATPPTIKINSTSEGTWTDNATFAKLAFGSEDTAGGIACSINAYVDSTSGNNSGLTFYTSASANTPLERMRIDKGGNVGIGVTPAMASSSYNGLHIGATYPTMKLSSTSSGHATTDGFHLRIDSTPRVEYWNYENTDQVFSNNNSEKIRILAGGGITFNGDTAAANALDDYEEGLWTPLLKDSSGNAASTYGVQLGVYTKIGRIVHAGGYLRTSNLGSVSGNIQIHGLPFTINNYNGNYCAGSIAWAENHSITAGHSMSLLGAKNGTHMRIELWDSSQGVTNMQSGEWTSDGQVAFSLTYQAT